MSNQNTIIDGFPSFQGVSIEIFFLNLVSVIINE